MPLSFRQLGNTFIAGPNIGIYPSGNSFAISGSATGTSVGIESISTIGSGTFSIASSVTNKNLVYKSLSGTSGFGIIDNGAATLLFTSSTPSIGTYISGITSAGTGNILLLSSITSDNNLVYKSISGGTGIQTVDDGAGTFKFDKIETGTIISGTNASAGVGVFCGTTTINNANDALGFYNLSGGNQISVTTNDSGEIVIDRGQVVVNTISNQDIRARIFSAITGNSLVQRTIISANTSGFTASIGAGIISPISSTDSDATAFITAASITDSRQITAIQNLVSDLKTNGLWDKMLAVYPIVGGNANSHKYNLKDPRDLDAAYRLDFGTSFVNHDFNGISTNAPDSAVQPTINTFIQLNLISALTNNIHLSFYSRTNVGDTFGSSKGANVGNTAGNSAFRSYPRYGGTWNVNIGDSGTVFPTVSDSLGFYIASRTSSTGNTFYKNGFLSAITSNTVHLSGISANILLLRLSTNPDNSRQMAFYSFGSGLTNSEALAYTTIIENYQTTLGRQVITLQNQTVRIAPTNTTADRFYITTTGPVLNASTNFTTLAASGTMGISETGVTTTRLLISAGTGAVSQIRLTPFTTEPTNPSNGSIWYSTSGNTLRFEKDTIATDFIFKDNNTNLTGDTNSILLINTAGTLIQSFVNSFGAFNALSSVTLTEGGVSPQIEIYNTQGSIISTAITGSKTILASTNKFNPELIVGKKFRFNAKGNATINSTLESHTLTFRVKLGSTVIALGTIPIDLIWENTYIGYIEIDATFTIRNSGLVISSGKIIFQNSLSGSNSIYGDPYIFGIYSQNATITTTSDQIFDFTIQSNSLSGNEIIIYESTLEILN